MTTNATAPANLAPPPDGLGGADTLARYNPAELARTIGGYREAWGDLGSIVEDLDAVGMIADPSQGHPWAPMVLSRLGGHLHHGAWHHLGAMGETIHKLLGHLHAVMARHVNLERERRLWHAKSNVVETMYWQSVAPNASSTTATVKAPYSGVNYMILDVLMDTLLTPPGFWQTISFASINFAQSGGQQISYATPGASGVQGAGAGQNGGMGFEVFLHDKTAPEGCRGFNPWTGWILSSDAVSTWQWANADALNARSLFCSILMRSSPCDTANWGQPGQYGANGASLPWAGYHYQSDPMIGSLALNQMYAATLGLLGVPKGHPSAWFQGQHGNHPGNYGSVGPGYGAQPTGHGGPFGPHMGR